MELRDYFESKKGFGVLSTSDTDGNVNSAVYARPHVMENGLLAFIMRDRLSYKNVLSNPRAAYLFREDGPGYRGKRLALTKVQVEENADLIASLSRRTYSADDDRRASKFLVYFRVENERPLVGS